MDASEPRVRRRGFFLHSSDAEGHDTGEHDNPEGFTVRVRLPRSTAPRQFASQGRQLRTAGRTDEGRSQVRSVNATGNRPRAHSPR